MNNPRDPRTDAERQLADLFAKANPRPQPPVTDAEEIRRAVYAEWDAVTGRRVWLKRGGFAAAASVLLAAALWAGGGLNSGPPSPTVARVERMQGAAGAADAARLEVGSELVLGSTVSTGAGQVALRLVSGGSLRVGVESEVVLTSADAVELVAGVLYFDSEGRRDGEFSVTTELGVVRDVGTQFLARLDGESRLDIGVRNGRVVLTSDGDSGSAGIGERLVATQGSTAIRRDAMPRFGSEWDWVEKIAPPFDIDGRTVSDFLAWFADQTGRSIEFGSPAAESLARQAILTGSIDLEPLQKLSAVLALANLTYSLEGARVVINAR